MFLIQDPSNIGRLLLSGLVPRLGSGGTILSELIEKLAPGLPGTQPLNRENDTWAVVYGFEQFLWQPEGEANRGIGVFFNAGLTDGKANPIKYSFAMGLAGKGVVPGRADDNFGIAWARTGLSDHFIPHLRSKFGLGLDHEDAVELYYSAAIAPWLTVTPSFQIVSSALNKTLDSGGTLKNLDTAYIAGAWVLVRF